MSKKVFYHSVKNDIIDLVKKMAMEDLQYHVDNISRRSILPTDIGKENWIWEKDNSFYSTFILTVPSNIYLFINGVWSRTHIRVDIEYEHTRISCLTNGQPIMDYYICLRQNAIATIYYQSLERPEKEICFSITGLAFEPPGRTIYIQNK